MTTLADRLRSAIDETERIAQAALDQSAEEDSTWWWDSPESPREEHISHQRPEVVLRRCAADRKILDLHVPAAPPEVPSGWVYCTTCGSGEPYEYPTDWPCDTVLALAEAYGVEV